ncbi:MAG: Coenzyme F420 hydrogenase/dehydrogenase, beta subunit C-terminal domain [Desulfobacterales bacterium]
MPRSADIEIKENSLSKTLENFLAQLLESGQADAVFVQQRRARDSVIMPVFISSPDQLENIEPVSPAFAVNNARLVSRLTKGRPGGKVAAVLRPCEIRAFIELVKLNQARTSDLTIIGTDCPGALQNSKLFEFMDKHGKSAADAFIESSFPDNAEPADWGELAPTCRTCTQPTPEGADLAVGLFGLLPGGRIQIYARTPAGENLLEALGFEASEPDPGREKTVESLVSRRTKARKEMTEKTREATDTFEKLEQYFSRCINCYNCRKVCPVCYCRQCVFDTDVCEHEPAGYMKWAGRKGGLKMPEDTLFYHLTRMAHMSTACVGCGQCSNACPSNIPVAELFVSVAEKAQAAFDYSAGRSLDDPPPLSVFFEDEFTEVAGIKDRG